MMELREAIMLVGAFCIPTKDVTSYTSAMKVDTADVRRIRVEVIEPALDIVLEAAEESEKNKEDAEKWRACLWSYRKDMDADAAIVCIDEILADYRKAQEEK